MLEIISKAVFLSLLWLSVLTSIVKNGEERPKYDAKKSIYSIFLMIFILYFAGFFNCTTC